MGNFDSYFSSPSTGKSATPPVRDICLPTLLEYVQTFPKVESMNTNLLEVAVTSETAHMLAATPLGPPYWGFKDIAFECHMGAVPGFTRTTTEGDDYNYHKAKLQLWPRETHWQTLLHSSVYTAISFSIQCIVISAYFRVM